MLCVRHAFLSHSMLSFWLCFTSFNNWNTLQGNFFVGKIAKNNWDRKTIYPQNLFPATIFPSSSVFLEEQLRTAKPGNTSSVDSTCSLSLHQHRMRFHILFWMITPSPTPWREKMQKCWNHKNISLQKIFPAKVIPAKYFPCRVLAFFGGRGWWWGFSG